MTQGSCACGAIRFECNAPLSNASACHCSQCRKMSGHVWASAQLPEIKLTVSGPVKWIALSDQARRGICPDCGAYLFWKGAGEPEISVALGAIDGDPGIALQRHIFTGDKGSYYQIADGLPHRS
ncbi:MAG: GFA family protein [Thalassovita sp.]